MNAYNKDCSLAFNKTMIEEFSLFNNVLNKTKPILRIKELGLDIWHPSALPRKMTLQSINADRQSRRLREILKIKGKYLLNLEAKLEDIQLPDDATAQIQEEILAKMDAALIEINTLEDELRNLQQQVNTESFDYVALTAKKDKKEIMELVELWLEEQVQQGTTDYDDVAGLGNDIYLQILGAAKKFNEHEKKRIEELLGATNPDES